MAISSDHLKEIQRILLATAAELRTELAADDPVKDSIRPDNAIGRLTRMEAIQAQSMGAEGRRRAQRRLMMIERALERLETGTYGQCLACGQPIPLERLKVMPEAPLCTACVQKRRG